jgi:hypothetical protein
VRTLQEEADAIRDERRLLEASDPVPAVHKKVVSMLRGALKKAHGAAASTYASQMAALEADENWKKLAQADRDRLLSDAGLQDIAAPAMSTDEELLRSLDACSLPVWASKADALPEQFRKVALAAARLLEPKTQSVHLRSGTLTSPEEVTAWLAETERELVGKLKKGPVVVV